MPAALSSNRNRHDGSMALAVAVQALAVLHWPPSLFATYELLRPTGIRTIRVTALNPATTAYRRCILQPDCFSMSCHVWQTCLTVLVALQSDVGAMWCGANQPMS